MQKILAFYGKPRTPEEQETHRSYFDALYDAVAWMDGFKFDQVTKRIVQELNPMKKPMPKEFVAVYHRLAAEQGWDKPVSSGRPVVNHHEHMLKQLQDMKPPGARWVLSMVEKGKVKFPDDIYLKLVEIAGQDEPKATEPPSQFAKVIESVKVQSDEWELAE